MDNLTPAQRIKNMRAIKSTGTFAELRLAKALWHLGYRYRKNDKTVFGRPDLSFKRYKIAVFVDSEFFHGKDWQVNKHKIKSNREYWYKKIERNIQRDREVNDFLTSNGWIVIRLWTKDIKQELSQCIHAITSEILNRDSLRNKFQ